MSNTPIPTSKVDGVPVHQGVGLEHVPTAKLRHEVAAMSRVGTPRHMIAALVKMSTPCLLKHYQTELDEGKASGVYSVGKNLLTQCRKGNTKAIMFYLQTQAGWRVTQVVQKQTLGADGNPVEPPTVKDAGDAIRDFMDLLAKPKADDEPEDE
jgi:hypothetical protein